MKKQSTCTREKNRDREKNRERQRDGGERNLVMEELQCGPLSHTVYPYSSLLYLQVFIATSHWADSRALSSATALIMGFHRGSSWISSYCPVLWRSCCFGSIGSSPFTSNSSQMRQLLEWASSQPWFWTWVVPGLVSLPAFPH